MFICLHFVHLLSRLNDTHEENSPVYVHVKSIIDFYRRVETIADRCEKYTIVHLANDGTLTVQETPEEILALINGATNDA